MKILKSSYFRVTITRVVTEAYRENQILGAARLRLISRSVPLAIVFPS
jgi:hypothetical protein